MKRRNCRMALTAAVCAGWLALAGTALAESAKDIFDATGVKGGLVVHVGCGDGKLTAALRANDSYLVHGLDADAKNVAKAREHIRKLGLSGKPPGPLAGVSVDRLSGDRLPYTDNLVNLVVSEDPQGISMDEVMRVLCPRGVAYVKKDGKWSKTVKPWPKEIDEWTHFLHDASNNAVADDTVVGPPRRLQWLAGPKRSRDHDSLASLSAMTSSNGRIFYIYDEGLTSLIHHPPKWRLIARDAFNGTLLWKRDIGPWITHLYFFRSGPVWLGRRLVSIKDRVYVTLGLDEPVTALDAETGRTLRTYEGSEKAEEIIYHDGILLVAVGDPALMNKQARTVWAYWQYTVEGDPPPGRAVAAYNAATGKLLWKKGGKDIPYLLPLSLTAAGKRVFYMDSKNVCCVDIQTGKEQWRAAFPTKGLFMRNYSPTVVAADGVLLCLTMDRLAAFSIKNGKKLWETKGYKGFASPGDLFVIDGVAWTLPTTQGGVKMKPADVLGDGGQKFHGFDVHTGKVAKTFLKKKVWPGGHHHRCYRNKATTRYLVTSRRGLEFIDLAGDGHMMNWWVRGECQYGVMPCNGLIYAPPDPCRCFNLVKVDGFYALAARNSLDGLRVGGGNRLTKGPAYAPDARQRAAKTTGRKAAGMTWHPPVRRAGSDDWPTFRRDITRSGSASSAVPPDAARLWQAELGGKLTTMTAAGGKLFVAQIDTHTVHALNAQNGKSVWRYTAGGPVDSPPTITGDLAIFGSRDGFVYAVRASDGQLAWRFRAAPVDSRILVEGRLESVWPVHGSVLVLDGVVYFAAGRSSYLDGGIHLYGLDAASGRKLHQARVHAAPNPIGAKGPTQEMTAALPDVLVSNGASINMRQVQFDKTLTRQPSRIDTLVSATGLLEDCWAHRHNTSLGSAGSVNYASHNGSLRIGAANPFGKLVVFNDRCAYAVQTLYTFLKHSPSMYPPTHRGHLHQKYATYKPEHFPTGVRLYAQANTRSSRKPAPGRKRRTSSKSVRSTSTHMWNTRMPLQIRAMVLADETIFAAGWLDSVKIYEKADAAKQAGANAVMWVISAKDGKRLAEHKLKALPVFDGLIAAGGRLYMATRDGKVICFGKQ